MNANLVRPSRFQARLKQGHLREPIHYHYVGLCRPDCTPFLGLSYGGHTLAFPLVSTDGHINDKAIFSEVTPDQAEISSLDLSLAYLPGQFRIRRLRLRHD